MAQVAQLSHLVIDVIPLLECTSVLISIRYLSARGLRGVVGRTNYGIQGKGGFNIRGVAQLHLDVHSASILQA
jgi:hypothetical protein